MKHVILACACIVAVFSVMSRDRAGATEDIRLQPTAHPPLPADPSQYWFVPDPETASQAAGGDTPSARLAKAVSLIAQSQFEAAVPLVGGAATGTSPLRDYADYYLGVALAGANRLAEADETLSALVSRIGSTYLKEAATLKLADVALARGDAERAEDLLEELAGEKVSVPEDVLLRLGRAEEALGHRAHALDAYRRVYYDYPLSPQAADAQEAIERLETAADVPPDRAAREMKRAEQLFAARRWAQARAAFEALASVTRGNDRTLVSLRIAECDYYLGRHRSARDALRPYLDGHAREAEARFFHLTAVAALGDHATYVRLARRLVADHPESEWAAETLNNLASHYVRLDDTAAADAVFRELLERFPRHRYAERAAWKVGWLAYRRGRFAEAAQLFERAAATFPRSDYRPSWLYWSAKARDRLGDREVATARYRLTVADYQNSYYGRLASRILESRREPPVAAHVSIGAPATAPVPTAALIRALAVAGLYEDALREVEYAQRIWGDSPQLQATSAWLRHRHGWTLTASERFAALRGAITTMRRAYPQFMAAGGELLPAEVLRIIFPLDYWPLIRKYAAAHDLDPYLIAALMAQESTFTAEIRSAANAIGLMQIVPDTGRRVARALGIRRFSPSMLAEPEINVRIGTKYFKDLITRFGGAHYALAGYNAGPHRVAQWIAEAPGLPEDEFIDNIPFPETQNYVKRVLGTAEDYRRLYGGGVLDPDARRAAR